MAGQSEKPSAGEERQKQNYAAADLRYLRQDIESQISADVKVLLSFFETEERLISSAILQLRARYDQAAGNDDYQEALQIQVHKNELRLADIGRFKKLLVQHADNPNVQEVSRAMDEVYEKIYGQPMPPEYPKNGSALDKIRYFLDKGASEVERLLASETEEGREVSHQEAVRRNEVLDDALDQAQTDYLVKLSASGHPNALFESYVTASERYEELVDKILLLPKTERDANIDILMHTLDLYEALTKDAFKGAVKQAIRAEVKDILEKQQDYFNGLRGLIQRGVEAGTDFAIEHLSAVFGDKDSVARNFVTWFLKTGRDLSKPVKYDEKLVEQFADESVDQIAFISQSVDLDKVHDMRKACVGIKANPDRLLLASAQEDFRESFREFFPMTAEFMRNLIDLQGDLLQDAYVLSHGENSQLFDADSTLRAKFFSAKGRDLIRFMRVYSPFGVFAPGEVEAKDGSALYVDSAYHRGWFRKHPILSLGLQSAGFALGYAAAAGAGYVAAETLGQRFFLTRFLHKFLKKPLTKILPVVGQVLLEYEIGAEIKDIVVADRDLKILEIFNQYDSFEEIPKDVREELRQIILTNEIQKRQKLFQGVGYDWKKFGLKPNWLDKGIIKVGEDWLGFRDDMKATGALREAVLAANRKLVLLGFQPYELEK